MARTDRARQIGFLGTGYIAGWHAEALRAVRGVRLAAACDRDEGRARALAARYGVDRVYTALDEMLAGPRLDAIHVLLPPDAHAGAAGAIIDSGTHVLLEKPMVTRAEEAEDLIARARAKGVVIGVGHNFLFAPAYERLREDLRAGRLGRPGEITITWNKPLPPLRSGPFDLWMLREPGHILLEIGSHSVAHLLDLAGPLEIVAARASNPLDLPGGVRFFRRWRVEAGGGPVGVSLHFSFAPGFAEHTIHVRGSLASATVDFERDAYVLHRHTSYGMDLDRYHRTVSEANSLARQARGTLGRVVVSRLTRSAGGPYGQSIARALRAFYAGLEDAARRDDRLSPELGRDVVRTCIEIARAAGIPAPAAAPAAAPAPPLPTARPPGSWSWGPPVSSAGS